MLTTSETGSSANVINVDIPFKALPKIGKSALVLSHSNADLERSLSIKKKMLTTQNMGMKGDTITVLRAIKATITECGGEHIVPISLDMVKVADKSYRLYKEQLKQEQMKKLKKETDKKEIEEKKRK